METSILSLPKMFSWWLSLCLGDLSIFCLSLFDFVSLLYLDLLWIDNVPNVLWMLFSLVVILSLNVWCCCCCYVLLFCSSSTIFFAFCVLRMFFSFICRVRSIFRASSFSSSSLCPPLSMLCLCSVYASYMLCLCFVYALYMLWHFSSRFWQKKFAKEVEGKKDERMKERQSTMLKGMKWGQRERGKGHWTCRTHRLKGEDEKLFFKLCSLFLSKEENFVLVFGSIKLSVCIFILFASRLLTWTVFYNGMQLRSQGVEDRATCLMPLGNGKSER